MSHNLLVIKQANNSSREGANPMNETVWNSCTDTAKLIRKALKAEFPGQKFSVRSSQYAGGASVRVHYEGALELAKVEEVAGQFKGATFDGQDDSMHYHTAMLDGQSVRYGADFVFVSQELSDEARAKAIEALRDGPFARETQDSDWALVA